MCPSSIGMRSDNRLTHFIEIFVQGSTDRDGSTYPEKLIHLKMIWINFLIQIKICILGISLIWLVHIESI